MPKTLSNINFKNIQKLLSRLGTTGILAFTLVFLALFAVIFGVRESQFQNTNAITQVSFVNDAGVRHLLTVEIANTPESRAQGLMNRQDLDEDKGMLFVFPESQQVTFWMKDTLIPLDIIYIDDNFQVVNIYQDTSPNQTTERYPSNTPIKYALETNSGWVARTEMAIGDYVRIE